MPRVADERWRLRAIIASYCLTRGLYDLQVAWLCARDGYRVDRDINLGRALLEIKTANDLLGSARHDVDPSLPGARF